MGSPYVLYASRKFWFGGCNIDHQTAKFSSYMVGFLGGRGRGWGVGGGITTSAGCSYHYYYTDLLDGSNLLDVHCMCVC
jgi:hypothetical protein